MAKKDAAPAATDQILPSSGGSLQSNAQVINTNKTETNTNQTEPVSDQTEVKESMQEEKEQFETLTVAATNNQTLDENYRKQLHQYQGKKIEKDEEKENEEKQKAKEENQILKEKKEEKKQVEEVNKETINPIQIQDQNEAISVKEDTSTEKPGKSIIENKEEKKEGDLKVEKKVEKKESKEIPIVIESAPEQDAKPVDNQNQTQKPEGKQLSVPEQNATAAIAASQKVKMSKVDQVVPAVPVAPVSTEAKLQFISQLQCSSNIDRYYRGPDNWRSYLHSGTLFDDEDFLPNDDALYWDDHLRENTQNIAVRYKTKVNQWQRISSIKKNPNLWGLKGIKPDACQQGRLGDSWFLSAATALAEYPSRIKKIFQVQSFQPEGIFAMQFYVRGKPHVITIDDKIPVQDNGTPINARPSSQGAWWLVVLEKAYAKLNLNYANLDGGLQYEAMRALTGQPIMFYETKSQTEKLIWETIGDSDGQKFIMTASCLKDYQGLVGGHAYTIIGVQELFKNGGQIAQQLIKMRNPIGQEEYTGPWNNEDDSWTNDFKSQAKFEKSQGFFYMTVEDFKKAFQNYDITYFHENWAKTSFDQTGSGSKWYYPFTLIKDQEIFLTYDQLSERMIPPKCNGDQVNTYNMILRDSLGKIVKQEPVSRKTGYGVINMKKLKAGDYQLQVVNFGNPSSENDFTISLYAQTKTEIMEEQKALSAAITRAESMTPNDVIQTTIRNKEIKQTGKSFLDETRQVLHIQLDKQSVRDARIQVEIMTTSKAFPFLSTQSNYNWRDQAKLNQVTNTKEQEFFRLELNCPKSENQCLFSIPQVTKVKKIKYY